MSPGRGAELVVSLSQQSRRQPCVAGCCERPLTRGFPQETWPAVIMLPCTHRLRSLSERAAWFISVRMWDSALCRDGGLAGASLHPHSLSISLSPPHHGTNINLGCAFGSCMCHSLASHPTGNLRSYFRVNNEFIRFNRTWRNT